MSTNIKGDVFRAECLPSNPFQAGGWHLCRRDEYELLYNKTDYYHLAAAVTMSVCVYEKSCLLYHYCQIKTYKSANTH
jgi:hypothetical protein